MNERRGRGVLVAAAFCAAVYAGIGQQPATRPLTFDNQLYYYMSVRAAEGVPPHISAVDHKHHLPVLVSALAIKTGRLFGVDDIASARAASIAVAAITTAAVAWIGTELGGLPAGSIATLALLTSAGIFSQAAMGFRPQLFVAAFTTLSIVAFGKRRPLAAGIAATSAFLCWQPAALVGAGLAAAALVGRHPLRTWLRLLAGAAIAILLYEAYYLANGALAEQLRQSYAMATDFEQYAYPAFADSLRFFLVFGLGWREDSSWLLAANLLVLLVVAPLYALVRPRATFATLRARPAWPATVVIAFLATAVTFVTHEGYPDMFFVEPWIAVAAGLLATWVASLVGAVLRKQPVAAAALRYAVLGGVAGWLVTLHVSRTDVFRNTGLHLIDQRRLTDQLDILYDDYGTVWAVGCPHLIALAGRENFLPYALLIDEKVQAYMQRDVRDKRPYLPLRDGRLPGAIIASRGGLRTVMPWLLQEYRRVENRAFKLHGIQMWVRRLPRPGDPHLPGSIREIRR